MAKIEQLFARFGGKADFATIYIAEAHAAEDQQRRAAVDRHNQADQLVYATEKSLSEHGEKLSEEERGAVEAALSELKQALEGGDDAAIQAGMEKLEQASHKLAEVLYQEAQQQTEPPPEGGPAPSADAGDKGNDGPVDADFEVVDDKK